jgi:hypothetical protein
MVHYLGYTPPFDRMSANENLDGDPLKVTLRDEATEPLLRLAKGINALQAGLAVREEFLPKVIQITSGKRTVTDFDGYNGLICVSPKMKSVIEQFEPDVHQFLLVKLVNRKKEFLADHWIWVVCNRIDSVDREHTNLFLKHGLTWRADGVEKPKLVFNQTQIGSCHFWRDKHLDDGNLLCSDEAGAALQVANLTALKLTHKETV